MKRLWHYCCEHSARGIAKDGFLKPGADGFVWVTDLHPPMREALGLTMFTIKCDRMAYEFQVADDRYVWPWRSVRRQMIRERGELWVMGLEQAEGARPSHWFVSDTKVPVHLLREVVSDAENPSNSGRIDHTTQDVKRPQQSVFAHRPGPTHSLITQRAGFDE